MFLANAANALPAHRWTHQPLLHGCFAQRATIGRKSSDDHPPHPQVKRQIPNPDAPQGAEGKGQPII